MPIVVKNSCTNSLNQIYYQTQLYSPIFVSNDQNYAIYLENQKKQWILAQINGVKSYYNIHYYVCKYNARYHFDFTSFCKYPSNIGWEPIAAPTFTNDITVEYDNKSILDKDNIKICILSKQIIIEPGNIINDGYLLINSNNKIYDVGKINDKIINKYKHCNNTKILKCDILCPGLIDIHTHGIGGNKNVLWYYKNPQYTSKKLATFRRSFDISSLNKVT